MILMILSVYDICKLIRNLNLIKEFRNRFHKIIYHKLSDLEERTVLGSLLTITKEFIV